MARITSLVQKIRSDFSPIQLEKGRAFAWDHTTQAITYDPHDTMAVEYLFHELGHATLNHADYTLSIHLLSLERDAWQKACTIAREYGIEITDDTVDQALDSYREWLHARTLCPECGATGVEIARNHYSCLACQSKWSSNEARTCALRRYKSK